jgi:hyperosmotically inducible protein
MRIRIAVIETLVILALTLNIGVMTEAFAGQDKDQAGQKLETTPQGREERRTLALMEEVRHRLVSLPYHTVFDWLEAEVKPDGEVILKGQVVEPTLKSAAEARIKDLESATRVTNNIEVLPLSTNDDQLRRALYRAIYNGDSPLFKYALQSVPPIHIIVKNGRVQLKGIVLNQADSQLAFTAARQVPGTFEVQNHLKIEKVS